MSTNAEATRAWSGAADELRKKMRLAMQDSKVDDWAAERMLYVVDYLDTLLQGFFALQNILVEQYGRNGQTIGKVIFGEMRNYVQTSLDNLPAEIKEALDNTLDGLATQRKQTEKLLTALEKLPEQWTAELVAEKVQPLVERVSTALTGTIDASGIQKALAEHVQSVAEKAIKDNRKDLQASIKAALDKDSEMEGFVRQIQSDLLASLRREVEDTAVMERLQEPLGVAVKEATTRLFRSKEWREEVSESARDSTADAVRSVLRSNTEETMADLKLLTADTLENMRQMQTQMMALQREMATLRGDADGFQAAVMVRIVEAVIPDVVAAATPEVVKMFAGGDGE
ncbi:MULTISPECIES: hypothetical protein [Acidithiobacillus]|uniref:hypothetical protein n=1 Tax=Acidithiobacillus ferrivorans TaxID=160808 RepID=UPI001C068C57|nr:hypothetical protein [Acidithiobacillus ferrivorans]MBU2852298.1 hypothetical protein [Acidithiobacillus ferrivorans]